MRTLVLNAGFEPLAVVTFRRAIVLVLAGKATIIAQDGGPVHGVRTDYARPSVILLKRYVRRPYRQATAVTRRGILRRDHHTCAYCGKTATTVDHITPRSRGGADTWQNLVACCLRCNNAKGDRSLTQMGWKLGFEPREPQGSTWHIKELEKPAPTWKEFMASAA